MDKVKFGTGGFRAVIGEDFTKQNVQLICQAISNIITKQNKKRAICIGYDNRFMAEVFAKWCAEVFAGNKIDVELCATATSTPVVMYATKIKQNDFGVMITASHNPYEYNGVKVFITEGKDADIETTNLIEAELNSVTKIKSVDFNIALNNNIMLVDYVEDYVLNIIKALNLQPLTSNTNIVFDAMFGSSVSAIQLLCEKLNLTNYQIINDKRDAFFSFKTPAPNGNNLNDLKNTVIKNKASIGFALDADGDRLAVIDEKGNYIDNNYLLAICYYFLVKYNGLKGGSVKNVATSNLLDVVTNKLGFKCYEVPVGFKHISAGIINNNAVIGGESSGGLAIHGHIWGKDSLLAIALCLKIMSELNKPFSEILNEVLQFANNYNKVIYDEQYTYNNLQKQVIDDLLFNQKVLPEQTLKIKNVVITDYVKIFYANGDWVLVRFSGTEPILRIFVEADDLCNCKKMVEVWKKFLSI